MPSFPHLFPRGCAYSQHSTIAKQPPYPSLQKKTPWASSCYHQLFLCPQLAANNNRPTPWFAAHPYGGRKPHLAFPICTWMDLPPIPTTFAVPQFAAAWGTFNPLLQTNSFRTYPFDRPYQQKSESLPQYSFMTLHGVRIRETYLSPTVRTESPAYPHYSRRPSYTRQIPTLTSFSR